MNELIDKIFNSLIMRGIDPRIIVIIIAVLPIAEARLAIPVALKAGLGSFQAFLYGFIGSSIAVPLLLFALIPLINFLASTRLFKKLALSLLSRIDDKVQTVNNGSELKRIIGAAAFVAVPLPLTGVWTGSAVASILGIKYFKALLAVVTGNLIALIIITIISSLLSEYINIIMAIFVFLAIITAISMLIKSFRPKKSA